MVGNPFTQERQDKLKADAQELLEAFSLQFLKSYGIVLFNKIKDELQPVDDPRKLMYRDWGDVERPDVFSGPCYMKTGEGAGSFGGWKKVFIAETQEYNIAVYGDEKAFLNKKKPKTVISLAGYSLERRVTQHYKHDMRCVGRGLGLTEEEVLALTMFSNYSWALTHGQRTNYVFQLHGEGGGCFSCGGTVDPEGGLELAEDREKYLEAFDRCMGNASGLGDSVLDMAFQHAVNKMTEKLPNLYGFSDDGTEAEVLTDMLSAQCLVGIRDGILEDLVGPVSLKIAAWYKTQGLINTTLLQLVKPCWAGLEKAAAELQEKIEPVIRSGLEPIFAAINKVKDKIKSEVLDKVGEILGKVVTPHLKPIFDALDRPMTDAFQHARATYCTHVNVDALPDNDQQRNLLLDSIPRTHSNVYDMQRASYELVNPLWTLSTACPDVFEGMDPYTRRSEAETTLLTTLDAAIYTLEIKIKEEGKSSSHKEAVLADYDHDVVVARAAFTKAVIRGLLITNFNKACAPVVDPVISAADSLIPEDIQEIICAQGVWDEMVNFLLGEPIDKMVDAAYPLPK